jgi:hypothetical protein
VSEVFVIVSMKHTMPSHKYVTFWRANRCGYCWPLSWSGHYDATEAAQITAGSEGETFSVPLNTALALSQPPATGDIDGDAGPVVPRTRSNIRALRDAAVHP